MCEPTLEWGCSFDALARTTWTCRLGSSKQGSEEKEGSPGSGRLESGPPEATAEGLLLYCCTPAAFIHHYFTTETVAKDLPCVPEYLPHPLNLK